jgi:antitoxin component HigA of HigAB toxin-antitoxin module
MAKSKPKAPLQEHPLPHAEILAWLQAQGFSQNDLARRLGREASIVSKVIRRRQVSSHLAPIHAF